MRVVCAVLFMPAILAQSPFAGSVTIEKIASGLQFTEGPCWRSEGYLVFSDVSGDTIYRWTDKGGAQVYHRPSGNSNGLAEDAQGRLLLAQHGKRRVARREADGTETPLATHYNGQRLNSPNDLAVRSDGGIYFTDPPYGIRSSEEELGFYGVYRVTADPQAPELLVNNLKRPNGIAFSPDESRLYVADTDDARVMVFDVRADGTLSNQRVLVKRQGDLAPDGIKVDSAGNLYIAGTEGNVWIYSPAGEPLGSIAVPEKTRNLAWGDADRKSLYVTSGNSVYRVRAMPGAAKYPDMTLIPGGEFEMGDHHNFVDPGHPSDEVPIHRVWLDAFYMGTFEVTNRQYVEFLNAAYSRGLIEVRDGMVYRKGANDAYCETLQMAEYSSIGWNGSSFAIADPRADHPVVGIRWHGAAAYTNWLSEQQGYEPCYDVATWKCDFSKHGYRLPTEAEWEYAGRGGQYNPYRNFPWGDDADYSKANWPDSKDPYETGPLPWTTPVGFYNGKLHHKADFAWPGSQESYQTADGSNVYGLYDMAGNVWEWCNDWYHRDYYNVSPSKNPPGPDTGSPMPDGKWYHVLRSGNWYNGPEGHSRVSNRNPAYYRGPQDPNHPYYHVGFRVVRPAAALTVVSAASYAGTAVAPASIASAFGSGLAGGAVTVKDSAGTERTAQVLSTSVTQVNFVVPAATATGQATITISHAGSPSAVGSVIVETVAPGLFSANATGTGVAAALAVHVRGDGTQAAEPVFQCGSAAGSCVAAPIDLGAASEQVILSLFGTGMRGVTGQATATVGGVAVGVAGPVPQSEYPGLDQVNLGPLPGSLSGRGEVTVVLNLHGKLTNPVTVSIQ